MRAPLYLYIPLYCLLSIFTCPAQAQTFPCDGRLIISLHQNSPPNYTYWVDVSNDLQADFEAFVTFPNIYFGAMGYNPIDNYIYACQRESSNIVRLKQDGSFEVIGEIPSEELSNPAAADCTPEGLYVCWEHKINKLLFFEVVNEFELVEEIEIYWAPTSGNTGIYSARIDDIAIDPFEPDVAYAFQRNYQWDNSGPAATRGSLLRINIDRDDPEAGQISVIGEVPADIVRHIGGLFFDSRGNLYGYGSLQGAPNLTQNRFISIDKTTGNAELIGIGPTGVGNDGCSCPYGILFEKTVSQDSLYCNTETVTFDINIQSRHVEDISGAIFRDTLPEGLIISDINTNIDGIITPGTGAGSSILELTDVYLSTGEAYYLEITAELQQINAGSYQNQAFLSNLPSELGAVMLSDNANTQEVLNDPTPFEVLPGIELDVIDTATVCAGAPIAIRPSGNLQGATISWTSPSDDILISSVFTPPQPAATDEGLYQVEASNGWCNDSTTFWLDVVSSPSLLLDSFLAFDYCESQTLRPIVQDSTGWLDFQWAPEGGLSCTDCMYPALLDRPQPFYTLTVTNEANCKDSATVVIDTDINTNVYLPDAFSPNDDGTNDTFTLYPSCAVKQILKFYIFDRWGNQVFSAKNYDPKVNQAAWDGTAKGKKMSTSLFTWMVEVEFLNGTTEVLSGDVQLIR
ncbi:MAG: T9SS type B sorting domain-containing protein [Bacteroidetes bacterium]|jgi:gliding motility-associated-like protein|nr:T9SS type B sorting domain-containing protein [Bacteroidota bacterium]